MPTPATITDQGTIEPSTSRAKHQRPKKLNPHRLVLLATPLILAFTYSFIFTGHLDSFLNLFSTTITVPQPYNATLNEIGQETSVDPRLLALIILGHSHQFPSSMPPVSPRAHSGAGVYGLNPFICPQVTALDTLYSQTLCVAYWFKLGHFDNYITPGDPQHPAPHTVSGALIFWCNCFNTQAFKQELQTYQRLSPRLGAARSLRILDTVPLPYAGVFTRVAAETGVDARILAAIAYDANGSFLLPIPNNINWGSNTYGTFHIVPGVCGGSIPDNLYGQTVCVAKQLQKLGADGTLTAGNLTDQSPARSTAAYALITWRGGGLLPPTDKQNQKLNSQLIAAFHLFQALDPVTLQAKVI